MNITIDTSNLKILSDWFKELSIKDQTNVWMSAFRRSAKPLIQTAQAFIPYKSKSTALSGSKRTPSYGLHRSIGVVPYPKAVGMWIGSKVSTLTVRQGKLEHVFYGRLVEWGHRKRGKKRGQGVGMVPATNFFRNALMATYGDVTQSVEENWIKAMEGHVNRLNRQYKKKMNG